MTKVIKETKGYVVIAETVDRLIASVECTNLFEADQILHLLKDLKPSHGQDLRGLRINRKVESTVLEEQGTWYTTENYEEHTRLI